MKKIFALLPMIAAFALAGCGNKKENNSNSENGSEAAHYDVSKEEAKQRVKALEADGYEIQFMHSSSSTEGDEESGTATVGVKDGYYWYFDEGSKDMFHVSAERVLTVYEYNSENNIFKVEDSNPLPVEFFESNFEGLSANIYCGFEFNGLEGLTKVGPTTKAGRQATEYRYAAAGYGVSVSQKVIVDNETGITLYWGVEGHTIEGEGGEASFEVLSFKTGAAVNVPAHE